MLRLVSGTNSLYLFVNLILVPVLPFPTHLFLHPPLLPLLIHHSEHGPTSTKPDPAPGHRPPPFPLLATLFLCNI